MRKVLFVFAVVSVLSCFIALSLRSVVKSDSNISEKPPEVRTSGPRNMNGQGWASLEVLSKDKIVAAMSPNPLLITYYLDQDANLSVSSIDDRNAWQLSDMDFIDSTTGFAVGNYGTLLKTVDAGVSWTQLPSFSEFDFNQVQFLNHSIGYIAGRFGKKSNRSDEVEWQVQIWRTENGGDSWKSVFQDTSANTIFQIAPLSAEICVASINGTRLIRTDNGGQTWGLVSFTGKEVRSVVFASDNTGWLVGGKGEFLRSDDAGLTWKIPKNLPQNFQNYEWWAIGFDKQCHGLAVSEQGVGYYTNNCGNDWKSLSKRLNDPLRFVSVKESTGLVLGSSNIYVVDFGS